MATTTPNKAVVITAILAICLSIGIPVSENIFSNELKDYYACDLTGDTQEFAGGISGTGYSGYPYSDSRKGAITCSTTDNKGSWIPIAEYAQSLGIDPYDMIEEKKADVIGGAPASGGIQYTCPPAGKPCILVK